MPVILLSFKLNILIILILSSLLFIYDFLSLYLRFLVLIPQAGIYLMQRSYGIQIAAHVSLMFRNKRKLIDRLFTLFVQCQALLWLTCSKAESKGAG